MAEPPPSDAFRPAYVGEWRETFRASQLRRDLLPRLKPPQDLPDPARLERSLERIWLDHQREWVNRMMHPLENIAYYGPGFRGQKALWTITPFRNVNVRHEEADPATWGTFGKGSNNGSKAESYRRLNGPTWVGQALAARLLGAVELWDHPAYFDYVDRWCEEEGDKASAGTVKDMWQAYRATADAIGAEARAKRTAKGSP